MKMRRVAPQRPMLCIYLIIKFNETQSKGSFVVFKYYEYL